MHPGRSARARESAQSHTGAMASDHEVMATLVESEGILLVPTIEELIDTAEMLVRYTTLPAKGPAIITNSGAFKGFGLDFCETIELDLPQPSESTKGILAEELPAFATAENPLDFTAHYFRDMTLAPRVAARFLADDDFGSLMVALVLGPPQMLRSEALVETLKRFGKPSVVIVFGDESTLDPQVPAYFRDHGICFFRSPERALRAMANITRHARKQFGREKSDLSAISLKLPGPGIVPEYLGKALLKSVSIPVPEGGLAQSVSEALRIATQVGYPVAVKAQSAALAHKTESGAVVLNVENAEALDAAWRHVEQNLRRLHPDLAPDGMLIEKMAERGVEMVVGARRDPDWGSVVLVGLGGIWVELFNDVALLPPDLTREEIRQRICQLRSAPLLLGARGAQPIDVTAVAGVVETVGAVMRSNPRILELDINPLSVSAKGVLALDVLLRISSEDASPANVDSKQAGARQ
jgi:acyl-CoA synthetase (NDP forming)